MSTLLTKSDLKVEMNLTDESAEYNNLLDVLCNSIESLWDSLTNRKWVTQAHTEYYSMLPHQSKIFLENRPITAITSIHDDPDWEYGSSCLIAASDYTYHADLGLIFYNGTFYEGDNNVKVVYTAGYTADNCPAWLKEILVRQSCVWYKQAKEKRWHIAHEGQPHGGTVIAQLKDNLLPEFVLLADKYVRTDA